MARKNGLEDCFVIKENKKLRLGYTTGSCAAAAAKAAVSMLLGEKEVSEVELLTPKGIWLYLDVEDIQRTENGVSCAVRKDGGDDPDATDGLLVYADVSLCETEGEKRVFLDGGTGIGRITKPGLEQPVGAAAINRVPRQMIEEAVLSVCGRFSYTGGIQVILSIPGGEEVAKRTFNPRLGIEGGLSVLGTSGIVVPMSEEALIASIRLEMEMKRKNGAEILLITPGNYGADFLKDGLRIDEKQSMKCSNYVGETLDLAVELGFRGVIFVAHIGKFVKVSGGIMNTHSRQADARAELMCAHAIRAGADLETARAILDTITTEEAMEIIREKGLQEKVMSQMTEKVHASMQHRVAGAMKTEAVLFSNRFGYLGETQGAGELLAHFVQRKTV